MLITQLAIRNVTATTFHWLHIIPIKQGTNNLNRHDELPMFPFQCFLRTSSFICYDKTLHFSNSASSSCFKPESSSCNSSRSAFCMRLQSKSNKNFGENNFVWIFSEFLALKCFIKDEWNDILETVEKVSQKFDQILCREYTKNLWDEIASKNTIISLLTENINNLSRLRSQSETCYQPQKHNKAQNTQALLDDQPFTEPWKETKENELRKLLWKSNLTQPFWVTELRQKWKWKSWPSRKI